MKRPSRYWQATCAQTPGKNQPALSSNENCSIFNEIPVFSTVRNGTRLPYLHLQEWQGISSPHSDSASDGRSSAAHPQLLQRRLLQEHHLELQGRRATNPKRQKIKRLGIFFFFFVQFIRHEAKPRQFLSLVSFFFYKVIVAVGIN